MSRVFMCPLKLTSIHDISGKFVAFGSALSSVWKQIDTSAAVTSTLYVFLCCMSPLPPPTISDFQFCYDHFCANKTRTGICINRRRLVCPKLGRQITAFLPFIIKSPRVVFSTRFSNNSLRHLTKKLDSRRCDGEGDDDNELRAVFKCHVLPEYQHGKCYYVWIRRPDVTANRPCTLKMFDVSSRFRNVYRARSDTSTCSSLPLHFG
ncbi:hypothetical protein EDD22DRAFT_228895 [Suillus occidentalis]|nr:hypothetical protein EDD22DRAFT_228895 [Suillus occidentalis]